MYVHKHKNTRPHIRAHANTHTQGAEWALLSRQKQESEQKYKLRSQLLCNHGIFNLTPTAPPQIKRTES